MVDAARGRGFQLFSISLVAFMATLDSSIVNISLPSIAATFKVGTGEAAGVVLGYLLFLASAMLLFGRLADDWGCKRLFLAGHCTFLIGSALCGLSHTIWLLIASRCLQGTGAAMLTVSAYALIASGIPKEQQGRAYGILATAAALGMIAGPPLGGLLTGYFSWRWVFLVNLPVGFVAIPLAARTLANDCRKIIAPKKGLDVPGALASFAAISFLLFALNQGKEWAWGSFPTLGALGASFVLLAGFLWWESRRADPLLDLRLFKNRGLTFALASSVFALMVLAGNSFLLPFYLIHFQGLSPQRAGLVILLYAVLYLIVGPVAGRLADRVNPRALCILATLLASGACATYALTLAARGLLPTFVFLAWLGVAYGLFIPPNNKLVMGGAPPDGAGEVSSLLSLFTRLGYVLGVSVFEAIFSEVLPETTAGPSHIFAPAGSMAAAFRVAYLCAALACIVGAVLTIGGRGGKPQKAVEAPCRHFL